MKGKIKFKSRVFLNPANDHFRPILFGFQEHDWGDFLIETWNHIPKRSKWWRFKKMAGFLQKLLQRCVKTCWREDNWEHFKSLCECEICIIISRSKSCIIVLLKFLSESVNIFFLIQLLHRLHLNKIYVHLLFVLQ